MFLVKLNQSFFVCLLVFERGEQIAIVGHEVFLFLDVQPIQVFLALQWNGGKTLSIGRLSLDTVHPWWLFGSKDISKRWQFYLEPLTVDLWIFLWQMWACSQTVTFLEQVKYVCLSAPCKTCALWSGLVRHHFSNLGAVIGTPHVSVSSMIKTEEYELKTKREGST